MNEANTLAGEASTFVLFRNVWRDGQRYVQGALVERGAFVTAVIDDSYIELRWRNVARAERRNAAREVVRRGGRRFLRHMPPPFGLVC